MKDDFNPNPLPHHGEDDLTRAFDELIEGLSHRAAGASDEPARESESVGACPEPGDWALLLSGQDRPMEVDRLLAHASACDRCSAHLHCLQDEPTPEELAQVAQLASASPEWQRLLAVQLAGPPRQRSGNGNQRVYFWIGAGIAACLAVAVTVGAWWRQATAPENMLAES